MRRSAYIVMAAVTLASARVAWSGSQGAGGGGGGVDSSAVKLAPMPAPEFSTACRIRTDSVDIAVEGQRVIFTIDSVRGRGTAVITRKGDRWPDDVTVRLNVTNLESLKLSCGSESIEDPPAKAFDGDGKATDGSAGPGGHYDVTVPRSLFVGVEDKSLVITWADVVWRR